MSVATAFPALVRPNQQLINELLGANALRGHDARCRAAHAVGERVRARLALELGDLPLPLLAVETTYSLLRGTASPELWAHALAGLHGEEPGPQKDRRGANHPGGDAGAVVAAASALVGAGLRSAQRSGESMAGYEAASALGATPTNHEPRPTNGPWAITADHGDLLGLPACIDRWGRDRVGVGAVIPLGARDTAPSAPGADEALLLAPTADAYARLCRLLSWRHEDADGWRRWQEGGERAVDGDGRELDLSGVVALVRDAWWGRRLAARGAEVWWRAGLRPHQGPAPFPIAAAPILRHLDERDWPAAPVIAAVRERRTVGAGDRRGSALVDLGGLRAAFAGYVDQLERGAELRARCRFLPGGSDGRGHPLLQLPPPGAGMGGRTDLDADAVLRALAERGMRWRYGDAPPEAARARLEKELRIIAGKRFATYVLTVYEMAQGRRTCGRGSAASSLVVYCLGLTNVDPVKYQLVFERFLAPERMDPPDIDIDFAWDERDDVLAWTMQRYGRAHVAMVATHQQMHRWAALREAARAHGIGDGAITAVRARLREADMFGRHAELPPPWPAVVAAADAIAGAPRHLGLHCGGVVITERPIRELVPVHHAAKTLPTDPEPPQFVGALAAAIAAEDAAAGAVTGTPLDARPGAHEPRPTNHGHGSAAFHVPTVAWEKDGCEDLGLVKIDVLGNRSLAVIRDCVEDLADDGAPLDERTWDPVSDPATQRIVAGGGTMGCFYIESPATRQLQTKVGSHEFDRLVVHSSIIRPAGNAFIDTYIARYHRWKDSGGDITAEEAATWWPHPALRKLLSESFGVLSYQEDVMLVSQELAGFGSKEANQLRKALGRADTAQRLQALAGRFWDGCMANGVDERVVIEVWRMISSFAGYSFCKAHSASYAVVSFQCAWLKAHHPAHFMARVIANEGGYYAPSAYAEEARRLGVAILPPCARRSIWETRREGPRAIRLGFQRVKGLSRRAADALVRERAVRPFAGVRDGKRRCGLASDELRALAEAGALDDLTPGLNHAQRAWLAAVVGRDAEAFIHPLTAGAQAVLDLVAEDEADPVAPPLRELPEATVRRRRWDRLGILPDAHPLCLWRLPPRAALRCRDVTPALKGSRATLVALSITHKPVSATYLKDARGEPLPQPRHEPMCFVTFEDETGLLETVWFPDAYRAYGHLIERGQPVRLHGRIDAAYGVATLTVERAEAVGEPA